MIIAIDGPAGSGKSTISKLIANDLGISYLDTGAMFRIVTLYFLENDLDINKDVNIDYLKENISIDIKENNFYLNGKNVSKEIRDNEVTKKVSYIAALKSVRDFLLFEQRNISNNRDIILDGRDIGTVVFPNSEVKIFLTASAQKRAKRRVEQNLSLNIDSNYEEILEDIIKRDELDSTRKISPLKKAEDAIEVDTTEASIQEVKNKIINIIKKENNEV